MPKKLTKKQQELADSWNKIVASHQSIKFSGKYGKMVPVQTKPSSILPFTQPPRGQVNSELTIRSVPMGAGGTLPIDRELDAAKEDLAWRTGALFPKGGVQYMTDNDLAELKQGITRRRN